MDFMDPVRTISDLLDMLDMRTRQVERLMQVVRSDRSEMALVKNKVRSLVRAATHFAKRGACLSLKAIRRGKSSNKLARAFGLWRIAFSPSTTGTIHNEEIIALPSKMTVEDAKSLKSTVQSEALPLDAATWQQVVEESSGDTYWWNRDTNEVHSTPNPHSLFLFRAT
jgi:hypothetical protein